MTYKLNDHNVHEGMYLRYKSARDKGGKVFLITPTLPLETDEERAARLAKASGIYCKNCDGCGRLGLQMLTSGPLAAGGHRKHTTYTYYKESWYAHEIVLFICPDCNGSGLFSRKAPSPAAVLL